MKPISVKVARDKGERRERASDARGDGARWCLGIERRARGSRAPPPLVNLGETCLDGGWGRGEGGVQFLFLLCVLAGPRAGLAPCLLLLGIRPPAGLYAAFKRPKG
jgi:hypothetical protein